MWYCKFRIFLHSAWWQRQCVNLQIIRTSVNTQGKHCYTFFYTTTVMSHATSPHTHEKKVQMACDVHAAT